MKKISTWIVCFHHVFFFAQEWNRDTSDLSGRVKSICYFQTNYITDLPDHWLYYDTKTAFNEQGQWIYYSNLIDGKEFNTEIRKYDPITKKNNFNYVLYEGDTTNTFHLTYNRKGILKTKYNISSSKIDSSFFVYNKKKLLIGEFDYQGNFSIQYFYNSKKKLIRKESWFVGSYSADTVMNFEYYDGFGRLTKDSTYSLHHIRSKSWEYEQNGKLSKETSKLYKASLTKVVDYTKSNTPQIYYVSPDVRDDRNYLIEYEYDSKGQVIRKINFFLDGTIRQEYTYEYNQKGLVVRELFKGHESHHHSDTKYEYVYDSRGNWIFRYSFDTDESEYVTCEYRWIEYFE